MIIRYSQILFIFGLLSFFPKSYSADLNLTPIKFDLLDNRIFVDVFINDQGPFKFIFDTGGSNSMSFELATKLNLPVKEIGDGTGAGNGTQKMGQTQVKKIKFGDINQANQEFLVMDFSKIQSAFKFKALDGIFGFEVLQKYFALIDFENLNLNFHNTEFDFDNSGFEVMTFDLIYEKPFIKTTINGLTANTLIDTGDRSALTITTRFLKHKSIARLFKGKPVIVTGYGIGGPIPARLSYLDSLNIGPSTGLVNVVSRAPTLPGGFNSIKGLDASIGNEILKQFNIGFDYKNKMIYLKKNRNFGIQTTFTPVPNP